ncbi:MAG TPA: hypothetical protein VGC26_10440 [Afipia sp.]
MPQRRPSSDHSQLQRGGRDGGPLEAASFIAETLADLKQLSRRHGLATLTYLLDLAHMEAEDIVRFQGGKTVKPKVQP